VNLSGLTKVKILNICQIFSARELKFTVLFQREMENWSVIDNLSEYFISTIFSCFAEIISHIGG